jgi:hypothetical protein
MFVAGYTFKPSHFEIHYMKNAKIDGRKKYSGNFTTDRSEAYKFADVSQFKEQLEKFLVKVNLDEEHYNYTLAYQDLNSSKVTKILKC